MRPDEFTPEAPGQLVRSPQGYWTFEPSPLPPPLAFDTDLTNLLNEASYALGQLQMVGVLLPNPHLLIRPFVRREAILSNKIEGTITRLDQLLLFEAQEQESNGDSDIGEVINYINALEFGLKQVGEGMPLCLRLLREVHEQLLRGVRGAEKRPGQFRQCGVVIGRLGQSYDDARFVPPGPATVDPLLRDFERFLNDPGNLPVVVQIALAHYQFESIHPFMDGNGRLGRLLITLMLCERGVLRQPLLYLSAYFERHDEQYRDLMLDVSRRGAWRDWVAFVARGVAEQSRDAVARSQRLLELWQTYRRKMQEPGQSANVLSLIDALFASPAVTIPGAARVMNVTFPTAQKYVERLAAEKIVTEVTGKTRNRTYIATEIIGLLDDREGPADAPGE